MAVVHGIDVRVLRVPCAVPYKSAHGTIRHLDTLLAQVWLEDGGYGFGEAVVISGYTSESHEGSWRFLQQSAPTLCGLTADQALVELAPHIVDHSHAVTCLASAIEMASGIEALAAVPQERKVELLAPVYAEEIDELEAEIEGLLAHGFRTLKLKVGMEVASDLLRVRTAQRRLEGRAMLRLDANQGYSLDDALRFAQQLEPTGIELFEQPCAMHDWNAAVAVRAQCRVPMMLDESITDRESIDRTAVLGAADLVKLKLVKAGGVGHLVDMLNQAKERGLTAILGNGVATEIGNWMEASVSCGRLQRVGEMNGFLKPTIRLFEEPLAERAGVLHLLADYRPKLDRQALNSCTLASSRF